MEPFDPCLTCSRAVFGSTVTLVETPHSGTFRYQSATKRLPPTAASSSGGSCKQCPESNDTGSPVCPSARDQRLEGAVERVRTRSTALSGTRQPAPVRRSWRRSSARSPPRTPEIAVTATSASSRMAASRHADRTGQELQICNAWSELLPTLGNHHSAGHWRQAAWACHAGRIRSRSNTCHPSSFDLGGAGRIVRSGATRRRAWR